MNNNMIRKMAHDRRVKCPYAGNGNVCWCADACSCVCTNGQGHEPKEEADAT